VRLLPGFLDSVNIKQAENLDATVLAMSLILRSFALATGILVSGSGASNSVTQSVTTLANNVSYWIPPEPAVCVPLYTSERETLLKLII
jgi:hypothetical protein